MDKTNKTSELNAGIKCMIEQLANETDAARQSELFRNYLKTSAAFWDYSWHNQMLIWKQLGPDSPWLIQSAQGTLKTNGSLTVTVRGLVLPDGSNPVPFFRAALSCQDPANSTKGKLFFTKTFPADAHGNSNIAGTVKLPPECIAPIILVTSPALSNNPAGFWFSVTGH